MDAKESFLIVHPRFGYEYASYLCSRRYATGCVLRMGPAVKTAGYMDPCLRHLAPDQSFLCAAKRTALLPNYCVAR
jgi:hypothetical protein